jgi:hypothetical protein
VKDTIGTLKIKAESLGQIMKSKERVCKFDDKFKMLMKHTASFIILLIWNFNMDVQQTLSKSVLHPYVLL